MAASRAARAVGEVVDIHVKLAQQLLEHRRGAHLRRHLELELGLGLGLRVRAGASTVEALISDRTSNWPSVWWISSARVGVRVG